MRRKVIEQRLLVLRQPEEVVLLANPLRNQASVKRAPAIDEILFRLELLAADAVPALIDPFVDIAALVDSLSDLGDPGAMPRLGRPNEVVKGDIQPSPRLAEHMLHLVAVRERVKSPGRRLLEDVLRMLVVPHDETDIGAAQPFVACDHVGSDLLVGRAEMRPVVDVVDGRGEVVARHGVWADDHCTLAALPSSPTVSSSARGALAVWPQAGLRLTSACLGSPILQARTRGRATGPLA